MYVRVERTLEKLDRVPRRYRPLASLASAPLLAKLLYPRLQIHVPMELALAAAAAGAAAIYASRRLFRPKEGGPGLQVRAFEVEIGGTSEERAQGARQVEEILKQRAKAGRVRYVVLSSLQGGYSRTIIGIGGEPGDVSVEEEVAKTLIAMNLRNVRVRDVEPAVIEVVSRVLDAVAPNVRGEPLFITPSQGLVTGGHQGDGIYLGTAYEGAYPRPIYLSKGDLEGHVGVFGSTGTGKTTTLAAIASRASKAGYNVIALDWAGEIAKVMEALGEDGFTQVDPMNGGGLNPFSDEDLAARPELLIDVLTDALNLTQPQAYLIMRVIEERGLPSSLRDLQREVERYPEEAHWDRDVKRGLLRKIGLLTGDGVSAAFEGEIDAGLLEDGTKVVRLDRIYSATARKAYALIALTSLFARRYRDGHTLVAIDEAHNLMDAEADTVGKIMAESRKYGLHLAIATQSPSSIPNSVLLNSNTKVVHALRSSRDKEVISQTMNLPYGLLEELDKLRPGEALVQSPSIPRPVLVRVELRPPNNNGVGDLVKGEPVGPDAGVPGLQLVKERVK